MTTEEWKDIEGYEDLYQVSNLGNIMSFSRYKNGKLLKPGLSRGGYLHVTLYKDLRSSSVKIHRVVASSFLGNCPVGYEVNHINGIKSDNSLENLEYVTRLQNISHAIDLGLQDNRGTGNPRSKLTNEQVIQIREIYQNGIVSMRKLAKQFGVDPRLISYIVKRKGWTHI